MSDRWASHSQCMACWVRDNGERDPLRMPILHRKVEMCCFCGHSHMSGIYVRADDIADECAAKR